MNAKILIADDHEVVRGEIKALLADSRPEWEICGEAAEGAQAVEDARRLKPDLVLLDISMPGMNGLEASARIKAEGIHCATLIFTSHASERLEADVRQAGAQGFVLKSQAFRDLVPAIDALLAGGTFFGAAPQEETAAENPDIDFEPGLQPSLATKII